MPRTILTQTYDEVRRQMLHYVKHGHFEAQVDWNSMKLIKRYLFDVWNTDMAGNAPAATMVPQSFNGATKVIVSDVPTYWPAGITFTVTGALEPIAAMNAQSFDDVLHIIVSDVSTYWQPGQKFTVVGANTPANDKQYTVIGVVGLNVEVAEAMVTDPVAGGVATADAPVPITNKQYTVKSVDGVNITVEEDMPTVVGAAGAGVPDGATATVIISSVAPSPGYLDPLSWLEHWFFVRYFTEKDGNKFEKEVMYYYSQLL